MNPNQLRSVGIVPLLFFLAQWRHYASVGEAGHILWMCHVANLTMAVGLFVYSPFLIRLATLWLLIGFPLWFIDLAVAGFSNIPTFFSHIGGVTVALVVMYRVRMNAGIWVYGVLALFVMQIICRLFTPANLNVNLAHRVYDGSEALFSSYPLYWVISTLSVTVILWLLNQSLLKLFPILDI